MTPASAATFGVSTNFVFAQADRLAALSRSTTAAAAARHRPPDEAPVLLPTASRIQVQPPPPSVPHTNDVFRTPNSEHPIVRFRVVRPPPNEDGTAAPHAARTLSRRPRTTPVRPAELRRKEDCARRVCGGVPSRVAFPEYRGLARERRRDRPPPLPPPRQNTGRRDAAAAAAAADWRSL